MATNTLREPVDVAALLKSVMDADMFSQDCQERIEALALAIKALNKEAEPADRAAINRLCDEISDASFQLMNRINSGAEGFGVNFKGEEVPHG